MKAFLTTLIGALFLSGVCMAANATQDTTQQLTDLTKPVIVTNVKGARQFTISLPANPTTGYTWWYVGGDSAITPVSERYHAPKTKLIGAGGVDEWVFKVKKSSFRVPQELSVRMIYSRSSETHAVKAATITVRTRPVS